MLSAFTNAVLKSVALVIDPRLAQDVKKFDRVCNVQIIRNVVVESRVLQHERWQVHTRPITLQRRREVTGQSYRVCPFHLFYSNLRARRVYFANLLHGSHRACLDCLQSPAEFKSERNFSRIIASGHE